MSNTPWEDHFVAAVEEIQSIKDPWDRVIAAEAFRDNVIRMSENLVRYETYRLRLATGLDWPDLGARLLVSASILRKRVYRWAKENGVQVPKVRRSDRIMPETTLDLRHLHWDHRRTRRHG